MNKTIDLTYFAKVEREGKGYIVTFRDFDNIFTEGDTLEETLFNAQEALDGVLMEMTKSDDEITLPTPQRKGEYPIPVSPDVAAPILLHILREAQSKTLTEVAKLLNVPYQQYQRLEHNCNMTLRSLKKAAMAMGGRVEIRLYIK